MVGGGAAEDQRCFSAGASTQCCLGAKPTCPWAPDTTRSSGACMPRADGVKSSGTAPPLSISARASCAVDDSPPCSPCACPVPSCCRPSIACCCCLPSCRRRCWCIGWSSLTGCTVAPVAAPAKIALSETASDSSSSVWPIGAELMTACRDKAGATRLLRGDADAQCVYANVSMRKSVPRC